MSLYMGADDFTPTIEDLETDQLIHDINDTLTHLEENPKRGTDIQAVIDAFNSGESFLPQSATQEASLGIFRDILESVQPLDFMILAYANNIEKLQEIQKLKADILNQKLDKKVRLAAGRRLNRLHPKPNQQYIIVIEELARLMKVHQEIVSIFPDGALRYYTNAHKCWKELNEVSLRVLLAEFATRCGIDRLDAYDEKNIEKMRRQFVNVATVIESDKEQDEKGVVRINLNNGVYVISEQFRGLIPHDPSFHFKYVLDFDYDPEATAPKYLKFLEQVQEEKEARMVMSEAVALALTKLNLHKCLLLIGSGKNGKSTWVDIITGVLGIDNVCSYTLSNIASDRSDSVYARAALPEYLINMVTEMDPNGCNPETVKTLIAREPIQARHPYGRPFIIRNYATMIFCANSLPSSSDTSPGWYRRWSVLNFLYTVPSDQIDLDLARKIIANERAGVFNWILEGVERLLENKAFTFSPKIDQATKKFMIESDKVALFLDSKGYQTSTNHITGVEMYKEFSTFCTDSGLKGLSSIRFYKRLEDLGYTIKRQATDNATWVYATNKHHQKVAELDNMVRKTFEI